MKRIAACVAIALVAGCGGGGDGLVLGSMPPTTPPPNPAQANVEPSLVFAGLNFSRPLALLQQPGSALRWYVVEQAGVVRVFDNAAGVSSSSVFIDLSSTVDSAPNEAGLLGMAFHPDFENNGYVYLSFTITGTPLTSIIARFESLDGGLTLDPATRTDLLSVEQPDTNHNGGHVTFGVDGFLYAAFGDGGGAGDPFANGQDTTNLLGTIIRINVDQGSPYGIPGDNPFAGNALCDLGSGIVDCPEIFAWGLRNPWRFSFDADSQSLYAGDVGQGSFEEINRVTVGGNYGWPIREGANCFNAASCTTAGLIDPIHEYGRGVGASVTGGFVYRGLDIPELAGQYVFGDFVSGRVFAFDANTQSMTDATELFDSAISIASFGRGAGQSELYIVDLSGFLYQIVPSQN